MNTFRNSFRFLCISSLLFFSACTGGNSFFSRRNTGGENSDNIVSTSTKMEEGNEGYGKPKSGGEGISGVIFMKEIRPRGYQLPAGSEVTLLGGGFTQVSKITINEASCEITLLISDSEIRCKLDTNLGPSGELKFTTNADVQVKLPPPTNSILIPALQGWNPISTAGVPTGVSGATVWTGSQVLAWGGQPWNGDGALYDPIANSWTKMPTLNAPDPREETPIVWTGSEAIIWDGYGTWPGNKRGAKYSPVTNTWTPIDQNSPDTPSSRFHFLPAWTGNEMFFFGGSTNASNPSLGAKGDGFRYNPLSDKWTQVASLNAPLPARYNSYFVSGKIVVILANPGAPFAGKLYDLKNDSWSDISMVNAPAFGSNLVVSTGTELICIGILNPENYIYNPQTNKWRLMSSTNAPAKSIYMYGVWTGTSLFFLKTGTTTMQGSTYDPKTDKWITLDSTNFPSARVSPMLSWTGQSVFLYGGAVFSGSTQTGWASDGYMYYY